MHFFDRPKSRLRKSSRDFDWQGPVQIVVWFLAALAVPAALLTFWTDSEIWAVSSNSMLFKAPRDFAFGMKPLFNFVLYATSLPPRFGTGFGTGFGSNFGFEIFPMDWARLLFGLNAFLIVVLVAKLSKELTGSTRAALVSAALLVTCSVFTYHGQRVRSDLLATSMFLAHLIFLFRLQRAYTRRGMIRAAIGTVVFLAASLAATPGAIYLTIAAVPAYVSLLRQWPKAIRQRLLAAFGVCAAMIIIAILAIQPEFLLSHGLLAAGSFFLHTFESSEFGWPYWHPMRFLHVYKLLAQNPLFSVALIASFGLFVADEFRGKTFSKTVRLWSWFSLIAFALMLLHPSKLPFFIASYVPFFSVFMAVYWWERRWPWSWCAKYSRALIVVGLAIFVGLTYLTLERELQLIWKLGNREQRQVIMSLSGALRRFPGLTYYDVIGLLPDRDPLPYFLGPGQKQANERAASFILESKPDVIVGVQKLEAILPELQTMLKENYFLLPQGLYVKAVIVRFGEGGQRNDQRNGQRNDQRNDQRSGKLETRDLVASARSKFNAWFSDSTEVSLKFYDANNQEIFVGLEGAIGTSELKRAAQQSARPNLKLAGKIKVTDLLSEFPYLTVPATTSRVVLTPLMDLVPPTSSPMDVLFRFDPEL